MTFQAKYPGRCEACGAEVHYTEVERTDTGLVHVICPDEGRIFEVEPGRYKRVPAPVCPRCFCTLSRDEEARGECDTCGVPI